MKKFVKIYKHSIEQHLILVLLLCSIYVFFHGKITSFLIDSTFVESFLVIKTNNTYTVLTFFGIIASVSLLYNRYEFNFSSKLLFIPTSLTLVYLFERFFGDYKIDFAAIHNFDFIYYFDIIVFFVDILFIITIIKKYRERKIFKREYGFFEDLELAVSSKDDEDILKYGNYARRLAQNIEKSSFNNAFAIGITGIWGAGKTSFMNLILKSFNTKKVVLIHFNPWSSNTVNQLIPNFFETIIEGLRNEGIFMKNDISKYLQKISQVELGVLGESFKPILNGFSDDFSIEDLKNKISDKIISKDKKIVITIDDLDRLNKQEINEVLRLIRNTANFSNVCYLVAYDKEYVMSFLEDDNQFNFKNYLEKIFQLEINLPAFKKELLIEKLKLNLMEIINEIEDGELKEKYKNQIRSLTNNDVYLESIENLRDITRLSNAMLTNFIPLAGEVDIFDFINLEILRMKYREVYELLKKDKTQLLEDSIKSVESSTKLNRLVLKSKINTEIDNNAEKILNTIFYRDGNSFYQYDGNTSNLYRISTPNRFILYFTYEITDDELSLNKLIGSLNNEESFKNQIKDCVDAKKQFLLNEYFEINDSFDSIEAYKNFIKGLFYFSSQESKIKFYTFRNLISVDTKLILKRLTAKPAFFSDEEFNAFYSELFQINQFDNEAFIKLNYIIEILKIYSFDDNSLLKKDKTIKVLEALVILYVRDCFGVSNEFGVIFHEVSAVEKIIGMEISSYKHLLKEKIKDNIKNVLKDGCVKYSSNTQKDFFTVHEFLREFFDNLSKFRDFLEENVGIDLKKETFYSEYLRFLSEIIDSESNNSDRGYKHAYLDLSLFD